MAQAIDERVLGRGRKEQVRDLTDDILLRHEAQETRILALVAQIPD